MRQMLRLVFVFAFLALPSRAQFDTADVLGTIHDSSGAVVPTASVTLLNVDTGIESRTSSDSNGDFLFTSVKIGNYTLSAEAQGFSKAVSSGIKVTVNARQRVDLTMQVGTISQTVEVSASGVTLQTDSSERGQIVDNTQVVELPLNGRNYSDLTLLTTGVSRAPQGFGNREGSFSVNGLRGVFNNFLLDGIDNNAYGTSVDGYSNEVMQPSPDAVTEFNVVTNNYSAEYGHSGGATVNVALRSGTNAIHGTAYDFLRNTVLNSEGYFKPPTGKPTLVQNQFGVTIGGPVVKNKVFFFADYEGFRSVTKTLSFTSIPSLADRAGVLPVTVVNPQTGVIYPANTQIPQTAMAKYAQVALTQFPTPTGPGTTLNYQQLLPAKNYYDKFDGKFDAKISDRVSAFARIGQRKVDIHNYTYNGGSGGDIFDGTYLPSLDQQAAVGVTWTVNPTTVLEGRFAVSRVTAGITPDVLGGPDAQTEYGISGLPTDRSITGGFIQVALPSLNMGGRGTAVPQFQYPLDFDPKVNLSKTLGKHSLKMGYEYVGLRESVLDINPIYGAVQFFGAFSEPTCAELGQATGCSVPNDPVSYGLADFMFGLMSQYQLSTYDITNVRRHFYDAYLQDDYNVSQKLTLNLGLRWEYATPYWERNNRMANFDPATDSFVFAKGGSIYSRTLIHPDRHDFAPRLGFAYSLMPKTVVRGGYGISYIHYDRVGSAEELGIFGPYGVVSTVAQSDPLSPSFATLQQGFPAGFASPASFNPATANSTYIPPNEKTPYAQSWDLDVQRQLLKQTVLDVAYVGNHAIALPVIGDYNQALPQPTPTSNLSLAARRPIQGFGPITWYDPVGFSTYHGLQVKVEHRADAIQFLNSFTFSHAIDDASQSLEESNGDAASPQNARNIIADKGTSNYDHKFTNVSSLVYQLPAGRGKRFLSHTSAIADELIGDWEVSFLNTYNSAPPINLRAWQGDVPAAFQTVGNLNDWRGGEAYRPNCGVGPLRNPAPGANIVTSYFNTSAITLQTDPSHPFGSCGRNNVRALPLNQLDFALSKEFQLPREGMHLQFRSEFFNLFNHTNLAAPNSDIANPAFGHITALLAAPRQIQFGLKLVY